jgi:hypothetical protein
MSVWTGLMLLAQILYKTIQMTKGTITVEPPLTVPSFNIQSNDSKWK